MQTMTFIAHSDEKGIIRLEIPTDVVDSEVEIVLVLQAAIPKSRDAQGYPVGYFATTYGSFAAEPLERSQPQYPDRRDELE